jgi:hypothetical protein
MKNFLLTTAIFFSVVVGLSQNQYPIKTIFKGDSVIILTIEQSEKINQMIDKKVAETKEYRKKDSKNKLFIDSLSQINQILLEENRVLKQLNGIQKNIIDSIAKINGSGETKNQYVLDSLWSWALGPSLVYTQYPDDTTIYIMDLSEYYLINYDFGYSLQKMSKKEYKKYKKFVETYGVNQAAWFEFRSKIKIQRLGSEESTKRKVWKYRTKWNRLDKEAKQ